MKDTAADHRVIDRLSHAAAMEGLSETARDHAAHLLGRLSSPVRVTLMGLPGSGKTEVLNMFAGERIIPRDAGFPTTELAWGDTERVILTGPDGAKSQMEIVDADAIRAIDPAFVSIRRPLPILRRIRLLEPVAPSDDALKVALDWAMQRTDIALWCTQEFGAEERALWADVPDALKDHAFMVLTKADVLAASGALTGRISGLADVVAEEFHSMFALATLQALKALGPDGHVEAKMFQASGGEALRAEVLRHADRGRRADFDNAEVFLVRHKIPEDVPSAEKTAPPEPPAMAEGQPAPAAEPKQHATPEARADKVPEAKADAISAQSPAPACGLEIPEILEHPVENAPLFTNAAEFLRRRGEGLAERLETTKPGATTPLVETCMDAVDHLLDLFSDDDSGCPAADAFIDELTEASELMVLMQIESGDAPAADAVTLLLQLRRDIETKLAA